MEKHILLVEDNRDDETLAVRALEKTEIGANVVVARDGAEALDYLSAKGTRALRSGSGLPSVVLLDLQLPKMDGAEVLKRIRASESTKYLPVVVFTSSGEPRDLARSYQSGATSYVRKPVDSDAFARTTQQIAHYWLSINEPSP